MANYKDKCRLLVLMLSVSAIFTVQAQEQLEDAEINQVDTVVVSSDRMKCDIKNVVIVPSTYNDEELKDVPYAVVYLLNGYTGDYASWIKNKPELEDLASEYDIIIVCPDGQDSWYFDSPIDDGMQFETYIIDELVPFIDASYRTRDDAGSRAIAGLSMGGHGALWLAFRHSDVFGQCGSMSGGVDITAFPEKWKIKNRLGAYAQNKAVWESHSVVGLVPSLDPASKQRIIIDCGVEDFMFPVNNKLHEALLKRGIAHDFIVRPGKHTWSYWNNSVDYQLLFFSKGFEMVQGE